MHQRKREITVEDSNNRIIETIYDYLFDKEVKCRLLMIAVKHFPELENITFFEGPAADMGIEISDEDENVIGTISMTNWY